MHVFRRVRAFWRVRVRPTWLAVSYLSNLAIAITTKNIRKRERARKYVRVVTFVVEDKSKALGADSAASVDAPLANERAGSLRVRAVNRHHLIIVLLRGGQDNTEAVEKTCVIGKIFKPEPSK